MNWMWVLNHHYNLDHLQEFYWQDGALYIRLLGRSVPEVFEDGDRSMYLGLCKDLRVTPRGGL